jgi:hypothetical protein
VNISASAVRPNTIRLTLPSLLALPANWVSACSTGRAMVSGTRLCSRYCCSASWKREKIGNAVNSASVMVTSGTRLIKVVKVRLLAVNARWSSRKRSCSVRNVAYQGQWRSARASPASMSRQRPSTVELEVIRL